MTHLDDRLRAHLRERAASWEPDDRWSEVAEQMQMRRRRPWKRPLLIAAAVAVVAGAGTTAALLTPARSTLPPAAGSRVSDSSVAQRTEIAPTTVASLPAQMSSAPVPQTSPKPALCAGDRAASARKVPVPGGAPSTGVTASVGWGSDTPSGSPALCLILTPATGPQSRWAAAVNGPAGVVQVAATVSATSGRYLLVASTKIAQTLRVTEADGSTRDFAGADLAPDYDRGFWFLVVPLRSGEQPAGVSAIDDAGRVGSPLAPARALPVPGSADTGGPTTTVSSAPVSPTG